MSDRIIHVAVVLVLMAIGLPDASLARSPLYQPVQPGWEWFYESDAGAAQHVQITGERELFGMTTAIRLHTETGPNAQIYRNYWTVDADGDVRLHGAENLTHGTAWGYDPPILWLDAPLFLGKFWSSQFRMCDDFDPDSCGPWLNLPMEVSFEGVVTVPLGNYYAYGVNIVLPPDGPVIEADGRLFGLDGRGLDPADAGTRGTSSASAAASALRETTDWYADGVGPVQFLETSLMQLVLFNPSTPIVRGSWGRMKAFYR